MAVPAAKRVCAAATTAVRRIAVEGNIAAGKSTFLRLLEEGNPAYRVVSEPLTRWQNIPGNEEEMTSSQQYGGNLLDLFYKDPTRWAYTFQTYACVSRLRAQLRPLPPDLTSLRNPTLFFERSVYSDRFAFAQNCHEQGLFTKIWFAFAKNCHERGLFNDIEWSIYCDWHSFLLDALPLQFDGIVYLQTNPNVCFQRLQKRNRPEENTVTLEYLESIHKRHEEWLVEKSIRVPPQLEHTPVLVMDCSEEFETSEERIKQLLKQVADFITEKLPEKRTE